MTLSPLAMRAQSQGAETGIGGIKCVFSGSGTGGWVMTAVLGMKSGKPLI
jgi:hypothetical protein